MKTTYFRPSITFVDGIWLATVYTSKGVTELGRFGTNGAAQFAVRAARRDCLAL
jgi:hypothetical protein